MQLGLAAEKRARHSPAAPSYDDNGDDVMQITPEIVRELLDYNPETGVFVWKPRGRHRFSADIDFNRWNSRNAGSRAGGVTCNTKGYTSRRIKIFSSTQKEHRLAWMWMTGEYPPEQVDHRNRDATDNRWHNLRASTNSENAKNMSMSGNNTSGVSGVFWIKSKRRWCAKVCCDGVLTVLGSFRDIDDAAIAVQEFRKERGFDPEHGLRKPHYHA